MSRHPIACLRRFLEHGIWETRLDRLPPARRLLLIVARIAVHVARSSAHNLAGLQAAGLTLVTLLALVPMLALMFALGEALGYADRLQQWLTELGSQLPVEARDGVLQVQHMVAEVDFGAMGVVGSAIILWSGLVLFTRVEQALNRIWRTRHSRPWMRRVSDFVSLIVLVPPLVLLALFGTSILGSFRSIDALRDVPGFAWVHAAGMGLVPHVLLWLAFTALYRFMPSARVRWGSALCGGVVAGSLLVFLHGVYLHFQIGVAQANAIYATLAALPLLLVYLQLVWTVVMLGSEVSYAVQNLGSLRGGDQLPPPSGGVRQRMMWHLMDRAAAEFRTGRRGVRLSSLARRLDLPREWVDDAAELLVQAGLLVPVGGDEEVLMPGRPPETIAVADLLAVLQAPGDPAAQRVALPEEAEQRLTAAFAAARREVAGMAF